MKSLIALLATLLALPLAAAAEPAEDDAARLEQVRQIVSDRFEEIEPEHVVPGPLPGLYAVRRGAIIAYISADGRYLIQGDVIDLDAQHNLTEIARNEARRDMMASLGDDDVIVFSPEEVKYTVSVFTDVECTYCRRLHSQIDEYLAEGIEVRYILYPRNGPTSSSWTTAEQVWCADDRSEALTRAKQDKKFESRSCGSPMVSRHFAMGQDVGLRGTPAIVFEDGTLVSGYLPPDRLVQALADDGAAPAASTAQRN